MEYIVAGRRCGRERQRKDDADSGPCLRIGDADVPIASFLKRGSAWATKQLGRLIGCGEAGDEVAGMYHRQLSRFRQSREGDDQHENDKRRDGRDEWNRALTKEAIRTVRSTVGNAMRRMHTYAAHELLLPANDSRRGDETRGQDLFEMRRLSEYVRSVSEQLAGILERIVVSSSTNGDEYDPFEPYSDVAELLLCGADDVDEAETTRTGITKESSSCEDRRRVLHETTEDRLYRRWIALGMIDVDKLSTTSLLSARFLHIVSYEPRLYERLSMCAKITLWTHVPSVWEEELQRVWEHVTWTRRAITNEDGSLRRWELRARPSELALPRFTHGLFPLGREADRDSVLAYLSHPHLHMWAVAYCENRLLASVREDGMWDPRTEHALCALSERLSTAMRSLTHDRQEMRSEGSWLTTIKERVMRRYYDMTSSIDRYDPRGSRVSSLRRLAEAEDTRPSVRLANVVRELRQTWCDAGNDENDEHDQSKTTIAPLCELDAWLYVLRYPFLFDEAVVSSNENDDARWFVSWYFRYFSATLMDRYARGEDKDTCGVRLRGSLRSRIAHYARTSRAVRRMTSRFVSLVETASGEIRTLLTMDGTNQTEKARTKKRKRAETADFSSDAAWVRWVSDRMYDTDATSFRLPVRVSLRIAMSLLRHADPSTSVRFVRGIRTVEETRRSKVTSRRDPHEATSFNHPSLVFLLRPLVTWSDALARESETKGISDARRALALECASCVDLLLNNSATGEDTTTEDRARTRLSEIKRRVVG